MSKRYAAEQARLASVTNEFSLQRSGQLLQDELKQVEAQAKAQEAVLAMLKSGAHRQYRRLFGIHACLRAGNRSMDCGSPVSTSPATERR